MEKFASGLLNYIESVNINGVNKTAFYSEFATNLAVGDKVFIINGNYDSDNFNSSNNFDLGSDGYTVLAIDRCRIVLDIDYTGTLPYEKDNLDNYIKVYHVRDQHEFDYINNSTINTYTGFKSKFEYGLSNNVAYTDAAFSGSTNSIFGEYSSITSGFYQKSSNISVISYWLPLINFLGTSSFNITTIGSLTYSLTNNGKLLIIGEDITVGSTTLKQRNIYSWSNKYNKWTQDIVSYKPFISKLNFRNGRFNGKWNDGVFGTYVNQIDWLGDNATWNSGIFLNSNWKNGNLKSKTDKDLTPISNLNTSLYTPTFAANVVQIINPIAANSTTASRTIGYNSIQTPSSLNQNYYANLNSNNIPVQSTDYSNNGGYGFNYILDSNIEKINIINGNFINCNIGLTNYGINSLDVYYGLSFSYQITSKKGSFKFCDINTSLLSNSNIKNSNIVNSNLVESRLSSNQVKTTIASGVYNSDDGINILKADLWSYIINGSQRGVLKLFISDDDLLKLQNFEVFYIKKINKELYLSSFNDETKVWLNLENKFILDYFNNLELSPDPIVVSVKNINENKFKTYISFDGTSYNNNWTLNLNNNYASIDIDLGSSISWYKYGTSNIYATASLLTVENVNNLFTNTNLCISNFESGLLTNTNWESGSYVNNLSNNIVLETSGNLGINLVSGSTNSLVVKLSNNILNNYDTIEEEEYIWLNGIDYIDTSSNKTSFSGTFKVLNITQLTSWRQLYLTEITNNISGLTSGGVFNINGFQPNYISINKLKIENSTIQSGLFKTALILNSTILNKDFNNLDQTLINSNISKLRFINQLFKDDNNALNSGIVYKSHILNTTWNNAISFNSIFSGQKFTNGIFNNGYWIDGTFKNGYFINSDDSTVTYPTFDSYINGNYRSWRNGVFNLGQFYNSLWIDGVFNNGRLYNSKWYGGIWNNGILGIKNSPYEITTMGYYANLGVGSTQTIWNNGVVESAIIGGLSNIYWYDGTFNDGIFTSSGLLAESIWYNGTFNGGKVDEYAKWKNGIFNNGKFLSIYGYTMSNVSHYSTLINNPGYNWTIGDTFSIVGADNNAYGQVTAVSTGSGLTLQINAVGNITGSDFILRVLTVSSAPTYSISTFNIWNGGSGYTASELVSISNFDGTSLATGRINVTSGGSVSSLTLINSGFGFSASATYSTTVYSGAIGPIIDASISNAGSNYIVGDLFTISFGTASGKVTSVGYSGNVLSFTLSTYGSGYTVSSATQATSLYPNSTNHVKSYTILNKGTNYTIGNYPTLASASSVGLGFTISIVSTDTNISIENCAWENGIFNGGQFGNAIYITNSSWFNGQFNGGIFNGKFWYSGIFTNGIFNGSATMSVVTSESDFVNSFSNNYYGVWLDGYVVEQIHIGDPNQSVYTQLLRASDTKKVNKSVSFQNMLWLSGTFSHNSGVINNSAWLDGSFISGQFNNSAFNPYVDQSLSGLTNSNLFSFNFNDSCVWINGSLMNSTFYISEWKNGTFKSGYMLGGIWRNGTWLYGTADNIYWEFGLWRNGTWNGSNFDVNSIDTTTLRITNPKTKAILYNIANKTTNNKIHLMNVFTGSSPEILLNPYMGSSGIGWSQSGTGTDWSWHGTYYYYSYNTTLHFWQSFYVLSNNYQIAGSNTNRLLVGLNSTGGTDIFTEYSSYSAKVVVFVDYYNPTISPVTNQGRLPNPVKITLNIGNTYSTFNCYSGFNTLTTPTYTADDIAYWTGSNKKFTISKADSIPASDASYTEVVILSAEVFENKINYNKTLNNTLYNIYGTTSSITLSATLSLPNLVPQSDIDVPIMFGNGKFKSGIWENGVWNSGWRNDETLYLCDLYPVAWYIKINKTTHRIQLQSIDNTKPFTFTVGDYVSVGNIIGIDSSGQRKLLKDKFRVVFINSTNNTSGGNTYDSFVLEYTITTPLMQITKDSDAHAIYVSKNIWLSGGFLSGYFSGIWNYGLVKGFPYTTQLADTHFIDGIFDGGHFSGTYSTFTASTPDYTYNTSLVQNFTFKDNNNASVYKFNYLSWIDLNWNSQSMTNIGDKTIYLTYSTILTTATTSVPYKNTTTDINGYITYDVLSSVSEFRKGNSNNKISLKLGSKFNKYTNFIPNDGLFTNAFSDTLNPPGLTPFTNDGWNFIAKVGATLSYEAGISTEEFKLGANITYDRPLGYYILDNSNTSNLQKSRYSMVELIVSTISIYSGDINNTYLLTDYQKSSYSLNTNYIDYLKNYISSGSIVQREYFYNRQNLNLNFLSFGFGTRQNSVKFSELSFYEVDMIPFFQYATESHIDQTIYFPYTSTAPYIDYTNANYNYVGNIQLTINPNSIGYSGSIYNPSNAGNITAAPAVSESASYRGAAITDTPPSGGFGLGGGFISSG